MCPGIVVFSAAVFADILAFTEVVPAIQDSHELGDPGCAEAADGFPHDRLKQFGLFIEVRNEALGSHARGDRIDAGRGSGVPPESRGDVLARVLADDVAHEAVAVDVHAVVNQRPVNDGIFASLVILESPGHGFQAVGPRRITNEVIFVAGIIEHFFDAVRVGGEHEVAPDGIEEVVGLIHQPEDIPGGDVAVVLEEVGVADEAPDARCPLRVPGRG